VHVSDLDGLGHWLNDIFLDHFIRRIVITVILPESDDLF
jgi:hypothetical protein